MPPTINEAIESLQDYCKPWASGGAGNNDLTYAIRVVLGVVAKLPKCWGLNEAGVLVRDVPVVPGMKIWDLQGMSRSNLTIHETRATAIYPGSGVHAWGYRYAGSRFYSTREAAEAAAKLKEG